MRLWPDRKDLLVPLDPSVSLHVSLPPSPAPVYSEVDTPDVGGQEQAGGAPESPGGQPPSSVQVLQEEVGAEPAAQEPGVLDRAHQILLHLHGRRGMKLLGPNAPTLHIRPASGESLLKIGKTERWDLDESHPMVEAVLGSLLTDEEKALYLASLVYTAANRSLSYVTDQDDVKFQQALADQLTEKPE